MADALLPERIHVVRDTSGLPLADISTQANCIAAADLIVETVNKLTTDEDTALHVSIAGGRKTMTSALVAALSLFARPQDCLSHVLVEPELFEWHPEFFFPPREPRCLGDKLDPGKSISTAEARIALAEIPFVRLRHFLPTPSLKATGSLAEAIARAQTAVNGRSNSLRQV